MAGERHFQPATERSSVQGGRHRFAKSLDRLDDGGQGGIFRRLAEFPDIGAADKGFTSTRQHDRRGFSRVFCEFQHRLQAATHLGRSRIHGRIVEGDDEHAIPNDAGYGCGKLYWRAHRKIIPE